MPNFRSFAAAGAVGFVAGLVGRDEAGGPTAGARAQTVRIVARLDAVLGAEGISLSDVVRLRIFLLDVGDWPGSVLPVLAEAFHDVLPPCTVVGVSALVEDWMRVEIEADAEQRR